MMMMHVAFPGSSVTTHSFPTHPHPQNPHHTHRHDVQEASMAAVDPEEVPASASTLPEGGPTVTGWSTLPVEMMHQVRVGG